MNVNRNTSHLKEIQTIPGALSLSLEKTVFLKIEKINHNKKQRILLKIINKECSFAKQQDLTTLTVTLIIVIQGCGDM